MTKALKINKNSEQGIQDLLRFLLENGKVKGVFALKKISKEDLVAFANKFFTGDYVVVYKRMGEDENVVKVENPGITPIQINRTQSEYLMNFGKIVYISSPPVL